MGEKIHILESHKDTWTKKRKHEFIKRWLENTKRKKRDFKTIDITIQEYYDETIVTIKAIPKTITASFCIT